MKSAIVARFSVVAGVADPGDRDLKVQDTEVSDLGYDGTRAARTVVSLKAVLIAS
jgi:hypothetical protein